MNLKLETIVQFFRKIIQLNAVIILKRSNEYYRKIISKSGHKMDLYPAMIAKQYALHGHNVFWITISSTLIRFNIRNLLCTDNKSAIWSNSRSLGAYEEILITTVY